MSSSGEKSSSNSRSVVAKRPCISDSESALIPSPDMVELPIRQSPAVNEDENKNHNISAPFLFRNPDEHCQYPFLQEVVRFADQMGLQNRECGLLESSQETYNSDSSKNSSDSSSGECIYSDEDLQGIDEHCGYCDQSGVAGMSSMTIKSSQMLSTENNVSLLETLCRESASIFHSEFSSLSSIKIDYDFERDNKHFLSIQNAMKSIIMKCLESNDPSMEIEKYVPYIIMRLTSKVAAGLRKAKSTSSLVNNKKEVSQDTRPLTQGGCKSKGFQQNKKGVYEYKSASTQTGTDISGITVKRSPAHTKPGGPSLRPPSLLRTNPVKAKTADRAKIEIRQPNSFTSTTRRLAEKDGPLSYYSGNQKAAAPLQTKFVVSSPERPPWRFSAPKSPTNSAKNPARPAIRSPLRRNDQEPEKVNVNKMSQLPKEQINARRLPSRLQNVAGTFPLSKPLKQEAPINVIHPPPKSTSLIRKPAIDYSSLVRPLSPKVTHRQPVVRGRSVESERIQSKVKMDMRSQQCNPNSNPMAKMNSSNYGSKGTVADPTQKPISRSPIRRLPNIDNLFRKRAISNRQNSMQECRDMRDDSRNVVCEPHYEGHCRTTRGHNIYSQPHGWNANSEGTNRQEFMTEYLPNEGLNKKDGDQGLPREGKNLRESECNLKRLEAGARQLSVPAILIIAGDFSSKEKTTPYGMKQLNKLTIGDNAFNTFKSP